MPETEKDPRPAPFLTRLSRVRYNPAARAFEAAVALHDAGEVFTYPVSLRAPMNADYEAVTSALAELARRRHARQQGHAQGPLRARRREAAPGPLPPRVEAATAALWKRVLHRAA